jgi:hypothetical protein
VTNATLPPPRPAAFRRLAACLLVLSALPLLAVQAQPDLAALLNGVEARLKAGFDYKGWTSDSTTVLTELDKAGRPEKITRVAKTVRVVAGVRTESILKAVETEDGQDADITRAYAKEQASRQEKERKRREEEARKGTKGGRRSGSFDLDEIMPFAAAKRAGYDFVLRPGVAGQPFVVLEARAKVPTDKSWNGVYTIDPVTFEIRRAEVRPSKNPRFVKELWAEADIQTLPGGQLFIQRTKFKVDGGIFIKHVRMIVEDDYTGVRLLD